MTNWQDEQKKVATGVTGGREWVGLTDVERFGIRSRVQEYTRIDSVKYGEAIQRATEQVLMEKNT